MPQLTYGLSMAIGVDGMIAQQFWLRNISSLLVDEVLGVKPGVPVKQSANGNILLCTADADVPVGIVVASYSMCHCDCPPALAVYAQGECAPVMESGRIYVTVSEAVAIGDNVYFNRTTGKYNKTAGVKLKAKFSAAASANDIGTVEIFWDKFNVTVAPAMEPLPPAPGADEVPVVEPEPTPAPEPAPEPVVTP